MLEGLLVSSGWGGWFDWQLVGLIEASGECLLDEAVECKSKGKQPYQAMLETVKETLKRHQSLAKAGKNASKEKQQHNNNTDKKQKTHSKKNKQLSLRQINTNLNQHKKVSTGENMFS